MPCDSGMGPSDYYADGLAKGKKEADKLADMLCRTLRLSEPEFIDHVLPEDIRAWWEEHQKYDRASGRK